MLQKSLHCRNCGRKTLHAKEHSISNGWGCFLTLITGGLFIILWIFLGILDAFRPFRCQTCGGGKLR